MKNPNDSIGHRNRELPACSAVLQKLCHRIHHYSKVPYKFPKFIHGLYYIILICPAQNRLGIHCKFADLLTYLLTPWSRVLSEKLTGLQLVKKFPAFYGTRKFITALTSARHLSLSLASPIQSSHPHPTS
jgi:hypothetical protein